MVHNDVAQAFAYQMGFVIEGRRRSLLVDGAL